jgi:hypothetical protein
VEIVFSSTRRPYWTGPPAFEDAAWPLGKLNLPQGPFYSIEPRLYLAVRMVMDLSQGKHE